MSHVFISYARRDAAYAQRVDRDLQANNFKTWRDVRDIDESQDFSGEIEFAIRAASHVVVCLTRDVQVRLNSFVRREIAYALNQDAARRQATPRGRLPLIPVVFPQGELPVLISTWTAILIKRDRDYAKHFEALLDRLRRPIEKDNEPQYSDPVALVAYLNALHDWTCKRLQQSVQTLINLSAIDTPVALANAASRIFTFNFSVSPVLGGDTVEEPAAETPDAPAVSTAQIFGSFAEAFGQYNERILLLGPPGSGKTTTLLAFARDAAVARLNDPARPVPLLASIRTWGQQMPLADWAQSQTQGVDFADHRLLYLLDGLDELGGIRSNDSDGRDAGKDDPRVVFMRNLQAQLPTDALVLTSRLSDYMRTGHKLQLPGAVTIQPLTDGQISKYLLSRSQSYLWSAVEADTELLAIARTPLLLCLLSIAYESDEQEGVPQLSSIDEQHIFDRYIHRRFVHETSKYGELPFEEPEARSMLTKLAVAMASDFSGTDAVLTPNSIEKELGASAASFVEFGQRMHFLQQNASGKVEFIHLSLRDYCALAELIPALKEPGKHKAAWAASILGNIGSRIAVPQLIAALYAHPNVQQNAARALGKIGDPAALPALTGFLYSLREDTPSDLSFSSRSYLKHFTEVRHSRYGWRFEEEAPSLFEGIGQTISSQPTRRDLCVAAIGAIAALGGSSDSVKVLREILDSADMKVSGEAHYALDRIGTPEALDAIAEWRRSFTDRQ